MARTITPDEVEWAGAMEFRFFDVDITNYDDTPGVGESFTPAEAGMSRFQAVYCDVKPSASSQANTQVNAVAQYDYANERIRLFYQANDGTGGADDSLTEVASGSNEGAVVRVTAIGR